MNDGINEESKNYNLAERLQFLAHNGRTQWQMEDCNDGDCGAGV